MARARRTSRVKARGQSDTFLASLRVSHPASGLSHTLRLVPGEHSDRVMPGAVNTRPHGLKEAQPRHSLKEVRITHPELLSSRVIIES